MNKLNKVLLLVGFLAIAPMLHAADSSSLSTENVTPQTSSGGGGFITGPQLFSGAVGKTTAWSSTNDRYSVGGDGYVKNSSGQSMCLITSGICTYGLQRFTITTSGMFVYSSNLNGVSTAQILPWLN